MSAPPKKSILEQFNDKSIFIISFERAIRELFLRKQLACKQKFINYRKLHLVLPASGPQVNSSKRESERGRESERPDPVFKNSFSRSLLLNVRELIYVGYN